MKDLRELVNDLDFANYRAHRLWHMPTADPRRLRLLYGKDRADEFERRFQDEMKTKGNA